MILSAYCADYWYPSLGEA